MVGEKGRGEMWRQSRSLVRLLCCTEDRKKVLERSSLPPY